jgi:hypothetical protein
MQIVQFQIAFCCQNKLALNTLKDAANLSSFWSLEINRTICYVCVYIHMDVQSCYSPVYNAPICTEMATSGVQDKSMINDDIT